MMASDIFINPSKIELVDGDKKDKNGEFYGGISYIGETLDNFLGEIELDFYKITIENLLKTMDECNVKFKELEKVIK